MTALLSVPLFGVVGLSIDMSEAYTYREGLQIAADAAALNAVRTEALKSVMGAVDPQQVFLQLNTEGQQVFMSSVPKGMSGIRNVGAEVSVALSGKVLVSTVTFHATVPTSFLRIIGESSIEIGGKASATSKSLTYTNLILLLDNSPSMSIGATANDRQKLANATPTGCVFACHDLTIGPTAENYYAIAKTQKLAMRIDTLKQSANDMATALAETRLAPNQYSVSVLSFGPNRAAMSSYPYTQNGPTTTDMSEVQKQIAKIDVMTVTLGEASGYGFSNFDKALSYLNEDLPTAGDGVTATRPRQVVMFVTDGVADYTSTTCQYSIVLNSQPMRCLEPIRPETCNVLKSRGISIGIIYTPYVPLRSATSILYPTYIAKFADQIVPRLMACASPGLFLQSDYGKDLTEAMKTVFFKATDSTRLTE